jgi:Protein of unknown function (DUF998)
VETSTTTLIAATERTTRWLLACGAIGAMLFVVVFLVEGATRPGYSAWRNEVSALSLSDQGWMQIANFLVAGALLLCFAAGLRRALVTGPASTWGPILVGALGVGLVLAGVFVTDPARGYPPGTPDGPAIATTLHGSLHFFVGGLVVFTSLTAAPFVLARRFAAMPGERAWMAGSIAAGAAVLVLFVAGNAGSLVDPHGIGSIAGLIQRVSLIVGLGWIAALSWHLRRLARPGAA